MATRIGAAALAGALLLLAAYRARQHNWPRMALGIAAAALLTAYAAGVLPEAPDGRKAVEDTADSLGAWLYAFTAGMAFFESFPPPFSALWPGEFGVIFAGAAAKQGGNVDVIPLIAIVWICSATADSASFGLGRRFGRTWLEHHGARVRVTPARLARLDGWFERWGTGLVVVGRLLPIARPLGPFVTGTSNMPYHRFLRWNLLGVSLFSLGFTLLGYAFYNSYDDVVVTIGRAGLAVAGLAVGAGVGVYALRRTRAA
jgi:membrane protein DedA with SNARE-associated domain